MRAPSVMNCPSIPIPEDLRRLLYGGFYSRGCGYKDVWLLLGGITAQEDERWTQTLHPNAEALTLTALAALQHRQWWAALNHTGDSPECSRKQCTQCGHQFSSWLFTLGTETTEPVTRNWDYSIVGRNQKHPEGERGREPCAKEDWSWQPPCLAWRSCGCWRARTTKADPAEASPQGPPLGLREGVRESGDGKRAGRQRGSWAMQLKATIASFQRLLKLTNAWRYYIFNFS